MVPRNEFTKPRQYFRFKAVDGTYVSFGSRTDQGLGVIIDISSGGLSFEYIPRVEPLKKISEIDIISDDNKFRIKRVACKRIYERPLKDENYTPVQMYQVGVQFNDLASKQIHNLVHFVSDPNEHS